MTRTVRQDYGRLLHRFAAARRAWKRAAVLSGGVVVVIEAVGALTLAALADLLFAPSPEGRIAILAAALATVLFFAARHVLKPLARTITNRQLAIYLEERSPEFEGSLIAAAEFGPDVAFQGRQTEIIDLILREAVHRVERFDLRKAIDLSRFHKYGVVAAALVSIYLSLGLLMPDVARTRLARLVAPWKLTEEEEAARKSAALKVRPVAFILSSGDTEILRGSTFELEAVLSRQASDPVLFHFRSFGEVGTDSAWKMIPMKELEKLNTFQATLPDVNEDCEFFVSSGPFKSEPHRVVVYDPLVVKGFELTTKYPAYMKLPDRVETGESADVTAPVGSTVVLKILTNRPLKSGSAIWAKGEPIPGTIAAGQNTTLSVSLPVTETATFNYRVTDVNRQVVESPAPATLTAVVDQPPTLKLVKPGPMVTGNALSEIAFLAEVSDDFGLGGGELVVARTVDGKIREQRFPLAMDPDVVASAVTACKATAVLALENLSPQVMPGEALTLYVEVSDRKGQVTVSDLSLMTVGPFEQWAYYFEEPEHQAHTQYFLEPVISATWALHRAKRTTVPKEFDKQAEYIAASMIDPKTKAIVPYINLVHLHGQKLEHGQKGMKLAQTAHDDLTRHDTATALVDLQLALAELKAAGYTEMLIVQKPPAGQKAEEAAKFQQELRKMNALMEKPPASSAAAETHAEESPAEQAAHAEALKKAQAQVVEQIKQDMAKPPAKPQEQARQTAAKQSAMGEEANALAKGVKKSAHADAEKAAAATDLANAAQTLHETAATLKSTDLPKALVKAEAAYQQLAAASDKLNANSQDRVNQLLADAAAAAVELHRKQEALLKQTKAGAKDDAAKQLGQQQVQLTAKLSNLRDTLASLKKVEAAGALKPETGKHVEEAAQTIKRARVEQKMMNAAVELAAASAKGAVPNQTKALEALSKIRDELLAANGARAADLATALAQAKAQAKALQDKLQQMGAKPQPKPQSKPAEEAKPKPGDEAKSKPAEEAKPKAGEEAKSKPGDEAKSKAGEEAEKGGKMSPDQRKDLAQEAADDAQRLADQLAARDFAKDDKGFAEDIHAFQGATTNPKKLAKELETLKSTPDELNALTQRVADRLEAAHEATLAAKRLFAAQREECPPQYRELVNRYFEALSKQGK